MKWNKNLKHIQTKHFNRKNGVLDVKVSEIVAP